MVRLATATLVLTMPAATAVHRFRKEIAGRTYLIEVSPVERSRWRAQIARRPGMPTALMPFYGPTPEEAADQLGEWLALAAGGRTT